MREKRGNTQKKNILLILSDGKDDLSEGAYALLKNKELENHEIRLFTTECFIGLNQENIEKLTIVGHASPTSWGNQSGNIAFNPEKFVQTFSTALEKANLDKTSIERLRCFGCELGFITEKGSYAQQMANEFAKENYDNLKLSAFTNRNLSITAMVGMRVALLPNGNVKIIGYDNLEKLKAADNLSDQIREKQVEIENLKEEISCCEAVNPYSAAYRKINIIRREIKTLRGKEQGLSSDLRLEKEPVQALDTEEYYQFPPSFQQEIFKVESEISKIEKINKGHIDTITKVNDNPKKVAYLEEKSRNNQTKIEALKENLATLRKLEERVTRPSYSELKAHT